MASRVSEYLKKIKTGCWCVMYVKRILWKTSDKYLIARSFVWRLTFNYVTLLFKGNKKKKKVKNRHRQTNKQTNIILLNLISFTILSVLTAGEGLFFIKLLSFYCALALYCAQAIKGITRFN